MKEPRSRENHPLYETWRWIIKNYTISKMVCERWLDFWNFVEDVNEKPGPKFHFHRHYFDKPYGPGNWRWRTFINTDESREKRRAYARQYRARKMAEDPFFHKNWALKRSYGITADQYKEMLSSQNGVCVICKCREMSIAPTSKKYRHLHVDHCHTTGKIRGLLCSQCNTGLGSFKDSIENLKSAIRYLGGVIT